VQLTYAGAGTDLSLSNPRRRQQRHRLRNQPNVLRIDLGTENRFSVTSSVVAGLTYENAGSPLFSHYVDVDISVAAPSRCWDRTGRGQRHAGAGSDRPARRGNLTVTDSVAATR